MQSSPTTSGLSRRWQIETFIQRRYKVKPCKEPNCPKDFLCPFYHSWMDKRRPVQIFRSTRCRYVYIAGIWMDPKNRCPNGNKCIFAHSRVEVQYHSNKYKTEDCRDSDRCTRINFCAFIHTYQGPSTRVMRVEAENPIPVKPKPSKTFGSCSYATVAAMGVNSSTKTVSRPSVIVKAPDLGIRNESGKTIDSTKDVWYSSVARPLTDGRTDVTTKPTVMIKPFWRQGTSAAPISYSQSPDFQNITDTRYQALPPTEYVGQVSLSPTRRSTQDASLRNTYHVSQETFPNMKRFGHESRIRELNTPMRGIKRTSNNNFGFASSSSRILSSEGMAEKLIGDEPEARRRSSYFLVFENSSSPDTSPENSVAQVVDADNAAEQEFTFGQATERQQSMLPLWMGLTGIQLQNLPSDESFEEPSGKNEAFTAEDSSDSIDLYFGRVFSNPSSLADMQENYSDSLCPSIYHPAAAHAHMRFMHTNFQ